MTIPKFTKKLHGFLALAWFVTMPTALLTGWVESVIFVSVISIYANFAAEFAAWQAARSEVKQDEDK